jgi:hypothetical protein
MLVTEKCFSGVGDEYGCGWSLQEAPSSYMLLICSLFSISILNTIVPVFVISSPVYVLDKFLGLEGSSKDWSFKILVILPVGLWCNQNFGDLFHFTLLTCFLPVLLIVIFPWKEGRYTSGSICILLMILFCKCQQWSKNSHCLDKVLVR